ncbi:trehalose-phosphatase [Xanthobacter autotrophicus]|uniref:trehalose-phosphatase n=1 Tax=Xanthobacter autotrophicus TaxID=280 RepID=UPI0024A6CF46|nr:trehalose-phosphatase [Xanthobacter autotrophicus]MDI4658458.1 trehalose-phosphatase [Xanthobacter autotrophicus]
MLSALHPFATTGQAPGQASGQAPDQASDAGRPDLPFPAVCAQVRADTHAFFLDVDGSLIDIADHPDAVQVPEHLPQVLAALAEQADGALALVSGRTIQSLDMLLHPFGFAAAGSHGAQMRLAPDGKILSAPALDVALAREVTAVADGFDGVFAEDKGTAIAVHYRAAPDAALTLRRALLDVLGARQDVRLMPGHCVFEVKPASLDKGTAVADFMGRAPFAGRIPLFIGDDFTDEAGFCAVAARGGLALAVGAPRPGAHGVLADPRSVRAFLTHLAAVPRQRRR